MDDWRALAEIPRCEQNRIRWMIRHHAGEMVEAGVAVKFGRSWFINEVRLPEFLAERTRKELAARTNPRGQIST